MMRKLLIMMTAVVCMSGSSQAQTGASDKQDYRRSSLCLIMLTHRDKKYAEGMERVFRDFPLPARYNEHNISDLRVVSVKGKQSQSDIDKIVKSNYVAQKVVGRWFNRNAATGAMNMDLIHERGGYGAFYADYQRSQSTIRGTALLRDEGIELLQSTFVLVCDMDYIDQSKGSRWGALGMALLSAAAGVASDVNKNKGNEDAAKEWKATSDLTMAGAKVVADIGGFRVKMNAYLYKLSWDDALTQTMYSDYWVDSETPADETAARKAKFDNAASNFKVEFVGNYSESSTKTILRSWKNEDEVILDVCERCVNKGMRELAKTFPIFRPRSPFYFEGSSMYSHIGRKEDVAYGKEYEVIQPYKDKKGQICYKRVGKAKAGTPWENKEIRFDEYFDPQWKGTKFTYGRASVDLHSPGLQLREL
ncbi:MAG: hypothetical protein IJ637_00640 [Prevotella sp.]|nr:hypothetical protein [Prevotella sp.]